jgi:hypothetical protein
VSAGTAQARTKKNVNKNVNARRRVRGISVWMEMIVCRCGKDGNGCKSVRTSRQAPAVQYYAEAIYENAAFWSQYMDLHTVPVVEDNRRRQFEAQSERVLIFWVGGSCEHPAKSHFR